MPTMIRALAEWMNFTPIFIYEPNNQYGALVNGTSYTGMLGMLQRGEVDVLLNPIIPTEHFAQYSEYTNPVTVEDFTMLSGKEIEETGFFFYLSVLTLQVWCATLGSLLLTGIVLALIYKRVLMDSKDSLLYASLQYVWANFSIMMEQDINRKWSLRWSRSKISLLASMINLFWMIGVALIIMTVFKSQLFSKLTVVKPQPLVDTKKDFATKTHIKPVSADGIEVAVILGRNSSIPYHDEMLARLLPNLLPAQELFSDSILNNIEEGRMALMHGYLIINNEIGRYFQKKTSCNLHMAKEHFFPIPLLVPMSRKLPKTFREKFNLGFTRLVDMDIPGRFFKPTARLSYQCQHYTERHLKALSLKNIYGVLILWGAGLLISTLALFIEIMVSRSFLEDRVQYQNNAFHRRDSTYSRNECRRDSR